MLFHGTTILAMVKDGKAVIGGDGQVTFGQNTVMKHTARKVRRLYQGAILAGFAGAVADALTLFERFEGKLEEHHGNLPRAAVALSREWRTDRMLGKLEALLIVADTQDLFILSGTGEVIEPDDHIAAVGSGGSYALAAARAFASLDQAPAIEEIVRRSLDIAADICIYTNHHLTIETLG
ncbi:MAG: HslU--HslV peptidase proteolytic subunit [Sulfobacillus benefaciens]|uniref:ATP-dependent protease subunit HslV n=1 Tax=Sulfobacillus benefaciens TaxID=453960 RepID=A0A2T2XJU0_9FIRM|nr:MAG: HslU--HslV peptidase proteolytic subunit [Sulfobacillus benefaciens]